MQVIPDDWQSQNEMEQQEKKTKSYPTNKTDKMPQQIKRKEKENTI